MVVFTLVNTIAVCGFFVVLLFLFLCFRLCLSLAYPFLHILVITHTVVVFMGLLHPVERIYRQRHFIYWQEKIRFKNKNDNNNKKPSNLSLKYRMERAVHLPYW